MTLNRVVGARIRRLRTLRNLTLKQVERKAKVSATHISELERGTTSPTIGALRGIARALGAHASDFLAPGTPPSPAVQRASRRREWIDARSGARIRSLGGGELLTLLDLTLERSGGAASGWDAPAGECLVYVLRGSLSITEPGPKRYAAAAGDTIHLHLAEGALVEASDGGGRAIWAVSPPRYL